MKAKPFFPQPRTDDRAGEEAADWLSHCASVSSSSLLSESGWWAGGLCVSNKRVPDYLSPLAVAIKACHRFKSRGAGRGIAWVGCHGKCTEHLCVGWRGLFVKEAFQCVHTHQKTLQVKPRHLLKCKPLHLKVNGNLNQESAVYNFTQGNRSERDRKENRSFC